MQRNTTVEEKKRGEDLATAVATLRMRRSGFGRMVWATRWGT
jgi:hypothetical protein